MWLPYVHEKYRRCRLMRPRASRETHKKSYAHPHVPWLAHAHHHFTRTSHLSLTCFVVAYHQVPMVDKPIPLLIHKDMSNQYIHTLLNPTYHDQVLNQISLHKIQQSNVVTGSIVNHARDEMYCWA
jgi:hypothetical protein